VGVVGPESQDGQISELTGPMQWPSGAPESAGDKSARTQDWRQSWEHLETQATSLGACRIAVAQTRNKDIFFGNAAGAPGNHSYCSSSNNFKTCIQFVFSFMYLYIYVSIDLHTVFWTGCRRCLSAIKGAPGDGERVNGEMHLEAMIV